MNESTFFARSPAQAESIGREVANCLRNMSYLDATGAVTIWEVEVRPVTNKKRTRKQNSAMWKLFRIVAQLLQEAGIDAKEFFKPEVEIPVTPEMLHEHAFNVIAKAMYDGRTSSELEKDEISNVGETFIRHLAQSHGISVQWPQEMI